MEIIRRLEKRLGATSWLFLLLFIVSGVQSLKNVAISIPLAVKSSDTVTLQCEYDLEQDALYTVRWYKGFKEFFRYIPKELPATRIFPISGMNIDVSRSGPNQVVLQDVRPVISGRYSCEVSADAPTFDTQLASGFMYVVDVPNNNPILEISKEDVGDGYLIKANCTTPPSSPRMNVSWYINGIKVNEIISKKIALDTLEDSWVRKPFMTVSYMEKEIEDIIHQGEVIKIQCVATLYNLYRGEDVRYINDNSPHPQSSSVIELSGTISCGTRVLVWTGFLLFLAIFILR